MKRNKIHTGKQKKILHLMGWYWGYDKSVKGFPFNKYLIRKKSYSNYKIERKWRKLKRLRNKIKV